jgi:hypothetical protein
LKATPCFYQGLRRTHLLSITLIISDRWIK